MNPTKETLNILQQFNKCSDNKLTIENINYLDNLYSVISNSISYISEFNINSIKFIQIKSLHNNDIDTTEFNDSTKIKTINFLKSLLITINKLKKNPIKETNNIIKEEYINFHNNIIKNIKEFISYYLKYVTIIETIKINIYKKYNEKIQEINILISNYNSIISSMECSSSIDPHFYNIHSRDPNFNKKYSKLKNDIDFLKDCYNYLDNYIKLFNNIKMLFKSINKQFLISL